MALNTLKCNHLTPLRLKWLNITGHVNPPTVVQTQMKESPVETTSNRSLCAEEAMTWNHWLLIDRSRFFAAYQPCSLDGGFNFGTLDMLRQVDICDSYDGETRLEGECTPGDGLVFRFRRGLCVPSDLDAAVTQRTYCVVTWSSADDGQTYAVLRHDTLERAWCLRYPTDYSADEGFFAYLFLDLRCHTGTSMPTATNRYLRLTVTRDHRHDGRSLCVDDYEACSYWAAPCLNTVRNVLRYYYCTRTDDAVALLVGHRTCDSLVAVSSSGLASPRSGLGQATLSLSANSIIWYRSRRSDALRLRKSNGSLPPSL